MPDPNNPTHCHHGVERPAVCQKCEREFAGLMGSRCRCVAFEPSENNDCPVHGTSVKFGRCEHPDRDVTYRDTRSYDETKIATCAACGHEWLVSRRTP